MRKAALVGAFLVASCGGGGERRDDTPADPAALAGTAAQQIMAGVPRSLGGGVEIAGAKADGRTLVLAIRGLTDWRPSYSDATMATTMKRGVCFAPGVGALTKAGGTVRLQSETAAGVALPPLTITTC